MFKTLATLGLLVSLTACNGYGGETTVVPAPAQQVTHISSRNTLAIENVYVDSATTKQMSDIFRSVHPIETLICTYTGNTILTTLYIDSVVPARIQRAAESWVSVDPKDFGCNATVDDLSYIGSFHNHTRPQANQNPQSCFLSVSHADMKTLKEDDRALYFGVMCANGYGVTVLQDGRRFYFSWNGR